jgi:hypothetical protein
MNEDVNLDMVCVNGQGRLGRVRVFAERDEDIEAFGGRGMRVVDEETGEPVGKELGGCTATPGNCGRIMSVGTFFIQLHSPVRSGVAKGPIDLKYHGLQGSFVHDPQPVISQAPADSDGMDLSGGHGRHGRAGLRLGLRLGLVGA